MELQAGKSEPGFKKEKEKSGGQGKKNSAALLKLKVRQFMMERNKGSILSSLSAEWRERK